MKVNKRISIEGKGWLMLCIEMGFMLCIFAPLEAYFTNKSDFWFSLKNLIPVILAVFLVFTSFMLIIGYLIKNKKFEKKIYAVLLCLLAYLYIQGNYVPRDYGVLNGAEIDWNSYSGYAIASIILLVIAVLVCFVLCTKLQQKIFLIGEYFSLFLILIQLVTIGTLLAQNGFSIEKKSDQVVVSKNHMLELSEDNNIIVFVLDAFDSLYMQTMLEGDNGETYKELFSDFTYYPDTLGAYPTTMGSLPFILTGIWYENQEPYEEYVQKAYENNAIYKTLQDNDYSIGVYTQYLQFLSDDIDMYVNVDYGKYLVKNYAGFAKSIYKLVAFNYMPHQLKRYFLMDTDDFSQYKEMDGSQEAFLWDLLDFYEYFKQHGISTVGSEKCFRLYHISGTHLPYTFDENLNSDESAEYDVYDETAGTLELLHQYLEQLKEAGIYNNSTIILMADHGFEQSWTDPNQNPLFMIKNTGECHDELEISSGEMSWEYLDDIFIALASEKRVDEEFVNACASQNTFRRFLYYRWDSGWDNEYLPYLMEYYLMGDAGDRDNMIFTGNDYHPGDEGKTYLYTLDTELSFEDNGLAHDYCVLGVDEDNWTYADTAVMQFQIEEEYNNLLLQINYGIYGDSQHISVYANNNIIDDYVATAGENRTIIIPHDYVKNGKLTLFFKLPDATLPTNGDTRNLALYMQNIAISSTDCQTGEILPD